VDVGSDQESLSIHAEHSQATTAPQHPTVLIVDDNRDLLLFLEQLLGQAGWTMLVAGSAQQAREVFAQHLPHAVLLDYMLGDDDGVKLGLEFQTQVPHMQVIIMTGGILSPEEATVCQERDIPVLRKPFLASDVLNLIRARLAHSILSASAGAAPGES
jgi:DNA-binding NtrC family response regulator